MAVHSILPFLLPAVLLLLACLLSVSSAQEYGNELSIADVQIVSVSGCVDEYPVTVNCSVGSSTLRIQTAAVFPTDTDDWWPQPVNVRAVVNGYSYFATTSVWVDPYDNTSVYFNISAAAYYPHITGQLVTLSFRQPSTGLESSSFEGFSYAFDGPPTLTSVSGCDGAGQATLNCLPDSAVLTLTGSGFGWYASSVTPPSTWMYTSASSRTSVILGDRSTAAVGLQVVNDSYATLSQPNWYRELLEPQNLTAAALPLSLVSSAVGPAGHVEYSYTTNALQIGFAPMPAPNITSWQTTRCGGGCRPDYSQLVVSGYYLYDVVASVNGVACSDCSAVGNQLSCYLPWFNFDPSVAYDVVVYNAFGAGNRTLPGAVRYSDRLLQQGLDSCVDRGDWYVGQRFFPGVQCPACTTITLRGANFRTNGNITLRYADVDLINTTIVDDWTITATLYQPNLSSAYDAIQFYGVGRGFTVHEDESSVSYNTRLYLPPYAPNISSVSSASCDSLSPLQLANCRSMAVITVTGTNLFNEWDLAESDGLPLPTSLSGGQSLGNNFLLPGGASISFNNSATTNTSLVFQLAYFDADTNTQLQPDVDYVLLIDSQWRPDDFHVFDLPSQAFRISLTYDAPSSGSNSSSRLSSGAVAGIVIAAIVAAGLLVAAVVWLVRRQWSGVSCFSDRATQGLRSPTRRLHSGGGFRDMELQ